MSLLRSKTRELNKVSSNETVSSPMTPNAAPYGQAWNAETQPPMPPNAQLNASQAEKGMIMHWAKTETPEDRIIKSVELQQTADHV